MSEVALFMAYADPQRRRLPTAGEHACQVCGVATGYGVGWPPRTPMQWFCADHLPGDFLPKQRQPAEGRGLLSPAPIEGEAHE